MKWLLTQVKLWVSLLIFHNVLQPKAVVLKLERASKLPGGLHKPLLGPIPRVCELVGLGWGLKMCIPNKFSAGFDAAHLGLDFENHQAREYELTS